MLTIQNLNLGYDNKTVLRIDDLQLNKGDIGCVLGPSGSGKSSFLHVVCGINSPMSGSIHLNQRIVFDAEVNVPASDRAVGMVFQDLCLFPHMTVAQNVAYGLHSILKAARDSRIEEVLSLVELSDFANRFPYELSGGQQQRVAIARALAPRPEILLMDEPFSSLDPSLREQLASDLRVLLKKLGITALIVTHDQQEAFAMADKIAVFADGKCQQWGSAYDLYHTPVNQDVATFIGEGTFLKGQVVEKDGNLYISTALAELNTQEVTTANTIDARETPNLSIGETVSVLVRPDDILHRDKSAHKATVVNRQFRGAHIMYTLAISNGDEVLCLAPSHHDHQIGEAFGISLDVQHLIYF